MRRSKNYIPVVSGALLLFCVISCARYVSAKLCAATEYAVSFDGCFSEQQKKTIESFLHTDVALKKIPFSAVESLLLERFPSIKKATFKHHISGTTSIWLMSLTPEYRINEELVLADSLVFKKTVFDEAACAACKRIDFLDIDALLVGLRGGQDDFFEHCEALGRLPQSCIATMKTVPNDFFHRYRVLCQDRTKWWLQDREEEKFLILFNGSLFPQEKVLKVCDQIKERLYERGLFSLKGTKEWVADTRFNDQVIVFAKAGGR